MRQDEAILLQKTYGTLTPELHSMCEEMVSYGVEEAAMESTATYWMPVWGVLVKSMKLKLVNPYFIKQLPGRKSDVKDAQWIAECLLKNLIKASFVPEPVVQDMRKYNHRIFDLNEDMTYNTNKLDAALQRCGFRLSNYVSNVKGKSYQDCIQAISEGTVDPEELVRLVHSRTVNKHGRETIKAALTGEFHEADILLIRHYQETIRMIQRHVEECQRALTAMCNEHFPRQFKRLQTIPAVKERAASVLIAETGGDMKAFKKATHLVGWAGLKPRNDESNRKIKSNRTTYGNRFLRQILIEVAWVASRTRNCFFSNFSYVQCTQKRKNKMKIQVAIARKILVAAWHMLTNEEDFIDVYLKRLEKDAEVQQQILELESTVAS
jgi:hypothetical protein